MLKVFTLIYLINCSFGANILFVSLVVSPSHHMWNEVLVEGLLTNGHNITKLGHFLPGIKNSNYTLLRIDPEPIFQAVETYIEKAVEKSTLLDLITFWWDLMDMCNFSYESDEFKAIMNYPKDTFNLIIFDVSVGYCYFPLIDHFGKPPVIGVSAFGMHSFVTQMAGHKTESYVPFYSLPYSDRMNFFERFYNLIHETVDRLCQWYSMKKTTETARAFFGKHIPNLGEYEKHISLIFSNDDPVLDYPKPFPPNVIRIGGVHVKKPQKMDNKLQRIMDEAKDGVIFVSMGSNFKSKYYRENAKKAFVEAFSRLNMTILWKFEGLDVPKNVILGRWFPQRDILAHPNTKLFITHCGGLSSKESMIRGVPIVGIPLFSDQHNRGERLKSVKGGVILKYLDLTADMLYDAITEVLFNPEYKKNMMRLSSLYQNQPGKPLERFLTWTEYVLKNGHLNHLLVAGKDMRWYQIDNWDVFAFIFATFSFTFIILKKLYLLVTKAYKTVPEKRKRL